MFQDLFAGVTKKELHGPSAIQRTGNRVPSCKPFPHKLLRLSYHNALASRMDMHLHHHEIKMKKSNQSVLTLTLIDFRHPKKMQLAPRATQIHPAGTETRSQIWYIAPISTLSCIVPEMVCFIFHFESSWLPAAAKLALPAVQAGTDELEALDVPDIFQVYIQTNLCLCTHKDSFLGRSQPTHFVKLDLVRIVTGFQPQRQKMRQPASYKNSDPEWYHHKSLDRG